MFWVMTGPPSAHIERILEEKNFGIVIADFASKLLKANRILNHRSASR
ncbi:hypothetical protein N824_02235 [Pedobacter sp. V48]|nr:hypothetical protein N824_02235 [Pedobacter sp. V48]